MDLVYDAVWSAKPIKRNNHGKIAVSWSCRNLVAFTTGFRRIPAQDGHNISDANPNQKSNLINGIHVVDPDCPWEVCSFSSNHEDPIHQLLWDGTGSKLLSVDTAGLCKVWAMKEHMINNWECVATADVGEGEKLVAVSWIDTGTKLLFYLGDDTHSTITESFEDRFTRMMVRPPYEEFPGRAKEGLVAISESGLICRAAIKPVVQIMRACLATTRSRVAVADVAFTSSGKVIVAANEGNKCTAVQFYRVSVTPTQDSREICSTPLPSLFPHCRSELEDLSEYSVTSIQFVSKFSGETVLVCTTGSGLKPSTFFTSGSFGSCVKRWKMERVEINLREKFQFQRPLLPPTASSPHTFRWSCLATYTDTAQITCLTLPRLPRPTRHMFSPSSSPEMTDSSQGLSYPVSALLLAYEDNKMKLLSSNSLVDQGTAYTRSKESEPVPNREHPSRVTGSAECSTDCLGAVCYSPCCCCVMGVTKAGDLKLYKFHHPADVSLTNRLKRPLVDLLEYCLLTGWEWWDVLMAIHQGTSPDTVEVVLRQLTEEYNHQPIQIQRLLLARFRSMKASLFRCMKDGAGQAIDCYSRQLLFAIATSFKSLLPSQNSVDQLNKTHSVSEVDVDKIVQALDNKDFVVESSALLSVQPLVQWITDLAMLVVVVFTGYQSKEALPGVSLIRDTVSLSLIREMLVLIRIWGQSTPGILPSITPTADKNESLALLFTILTKIWLQNAEEPEQHDKRVAVEAAPLLPNQLFLQNMQTPTLNRGVSGKTVSGHVRSRLYQFGHKPAAQLAGNFQHPFASAIFPAPSDGSHHLDVTRRIYLDASSDTKLKQCTRCNCLSLINSVSEQMISRAWDHEWVKSCVCGGSWRRYDRQQQRILAER